MNGPNAVTAAFEGKPLSRAPLAIAVVGKGVHLERAGGRRVWRRLWRALSDWLPGDAHDDRR